MTTLNYTEYINELKNYYNKYTEKYLKPKLEKKNKKTTNKKPMIYNFFHDKDNNALLYNYTKKNGEVKYYTIYLPYIYNINLILDKIIYNINKHKYSYENDNTIYETYKNLLILHNELLTFKRNNIINTDVEYSNLLLEENSILNQISTINKNKNKDSSQLLNLLSLGYNLGDFKINKTKLSKLNNVRIKYDNKIGYIDTINENNGKVNIKNETNEFFLINIEPFSIPHSINHLKNEGYKLHYSLIELLNIVSNKDLLLVLLNINNINIDDIKSRPYKLGLSTNLINKKLLKLINPHFKLINNIYIDLPIHKNKLYDKQIKLYLKKNMDSKHTIDNSNINKKTRDLLSYYNESPIKIDNFTFNSIAHYHLASIFYNRTDLNTETMNKYNEIFYQFTKEYNSTFKLYDKSIESIKQYLSTINYDKPLDWDNKISTKYLIKAYIAKSQNNINFKTELLSTNKTLIIEYINHNNIINYELMFVRYCITNNLNLDEFLNFNSNPKIYTFFNKLVNETNISNPQLLTDLFIKYDVYNNINLEYSNIINEYFKIDTTGKMTKDILVNIIEILVYSYNSLYLYESINNYLIEKKDSANITDYKTSIKLRDNELWIVNFLYDYIVKLNNIKYDITLKTQLENIEKIKTMSIEIINKYKIGFLNLKRVVNTYKYNLVDVPLHKNSIYFSLVDLLNRNHIYPFNFNNKYDKREKVDNSQELVLNIIDNLEYPVYVNAAKELKKKVKQFYKNEIDLSNVENILKAVVILFKIDILLISELENKEYKLEKIKLEFPEIEIDDKPNGLIVLAQIKETLFYLPTKPDYTKAIEIVEYLMDIKHGILILEEEIEGKKKHKLVGKVNFKTMNVKFESIDKSKLSDTKKLEIEHVQIIKIVRNDVSYYYFKDHLIYL